MEDNLQGQRLFVTRLAIGLAQGAALYLLYSAYDDKVWPATQGTLFAPLAVSWFFIPFLLISALGEMKWRKALGWTAIALAAISTLAFFDNWMAWPQDWGSGATAAGRPHVTPSPQFFFFGGAGLFIAHALVVGASIDRRARAKYPTHFDVAWKMALQLILVALFEGAASATRSSVYACLANLARQHGFDFFKQALNDAKDHEEPSLKLIWVF